MGGRQPRSPNGKRANSDFSKRHVPQEERSNCEGHTARHVHVCPKARSSPEWFHTSDPGLLRLQRKSLDPEEVSQDETRLEAAFRPAACPAVTPDTEQSPTSVQVKDYRHVCSQPAQHIPRFLRASHVVQVQRGSSVAFFSTLNARRCIVARSASTHPCFDVCGFPQGDGCL